MNTPRAEAPLYVPHAQRVSLRPGDPSLVPPHVTRRMTPLQKAVLEAYARARAEAPDDFARWAADRAPILYASPYGELGASAALHETIFTSAYPVSPTSFQHSVDNAAPAYIAITHGAPHPCLSISMGFLSFDMALFWGASQLRAGRHGTVLVIHAADSVTYATDVTAEAELLVLSTTPPADGRGPRVRLGAVRHDARASACPVGPSPEVHRETTGTLTPPLDLGARTHAFTRTVTSHDGMAITSFWEPLP